MFFLCKLKGFYAGTYVSVLKQQQKKVQMGEQEALIEILKKLWTPYLEMQGLGIGDIPFTGLF